MNNRASEDRLNIPVDSVTTVVDKGVVFQGSLSASNGRTIMIAGEFYGELVTNGAVIIGQGAVFAGSLVADRVRLQGQIIKSKGGESRVVVNDVLIMEAGSKMETEELSYRGLEMRYGASLKANVVPFEDEVSHCDMQRDHVDGAMHGTDLVDSPE